MPGLRWGPYSISTDAEPNTRTNLRSHLPGVHHLAKLSGDKEIGQI